MKQTLDAHRSERGQAILIMTAVLSVVLIAAIGLGIDAGQLYAQKQRAQAAADAGPALSPA